MELFGKGFFIWQINQCEDGVVERIAEVAAQANLSFVMLKVADGKFPYWKNQDKLQPLVAALRSRGISPWGWQYIYGVEPEAEARVAVRQVRELNLDGFVVNAEAEYKQPGKAQAARTYMGILGNDLPNTALALSSYRFPSYHPQFPWAEFLEVADFNFPQVYWQGAHNPRVQLQRTLREFQAMTPLRPVYPTGAAYAEHSWQPTPADIQEFLAAGRDFGVRAVSFWEWSPARALNFWNTISAFPWQPQTQQAPDIVDRLVAALNTGDPNEMVRLYAPDAGHVTPDHSVKGVDAILKWYTRLFKDLLPNARFQVTGYSGTGPNRHVTWTAHSAKGSVLNGNDTFSTQADRIVYHFSYFSVS